MIKINSSDHKNTRFTAFDINNLLISSIKFSNFENNIELTSWACFWWHSSPITTSYFNTSNIINNSQHESNYGILGIDNHNLNINHCSFIHNRANNIGKLFCQYNTDGLFTIYDCYIDMISFSNPGDYYIINPIRLFFINTYQYSNIKTFTLFNNCQNEEDINFNNYYNFEYFSQYNQCYLLNKDISCICKYSINNIYLSNQYLFSLVVFYI
jgi:hypothetical protein